MDDPRKDEPARITRDQRADAVFRVMWICVLLAMACVIVGGFMLRYFLEDLSGFLFLASLPCALLAIAFGAAYLVMERRTERLRRRVLASAVVAIPLLAVALYAMLMWAFLAGGGL